MASYNEGLLVFTTQRHNKRITATILLDDSDEKSLDRKKKRTRYQKITGAFVEKFLSCFNACFASHEQSQCPRPQVDWLAFPVLLQLPASLHLCVPPDQIYKVSQLGGGGGGVETVPPHVPEFVQLHGEQQSDVQSGQFGVLSTTHMSPNSCSYTGRYNPTCSLDNSGFYQWFH